MLACPCNHATTQAQAADAQPLACTKWPNQVMQDIECQCCHAAVQGHNAALCKGRARRGHDASYAPAEAACRRCGGQPLPGPAARLCQDCWASDVANTRSLATGPLPGLSFFLRLLRQGFLQPGPCQVLPLPQSADCMLLPCALRFALKAAGGGLLIMLRKGLFQILPALDPACARSRL